MSLPMLRTRLVPLFLRRAHRLKVDTSGLAKRFRLPNDAADAAEVSIGLEAFHRFGSELATRASDDLFGFHTALDARRGDFGTLEYVLRNAPTVKAALERLGRHGRTINAQVRVAFDARTGRLVERIPGHPTALGRHGNDFAVAHKVKLARELLGASFAPVRVFFAHPAPKAAASMRALRTWFHGTELVFSADMNGIELPAGVLAMPIEGADPTLLELLERNLGNADDETNDDDPIALLRRAIADDLASTAVNGDRLASRLGMSKRTLHRRLASAGIALREMIDDVRREMALAYLKEEDRPISEIATCLGYSDARAFTRAFRRWTGATPASHRSRP